MMMSLHNTNWRWTDFQRNPLSGVHAAHLSRCLAPVDIQDEPVLRQAFEDPLVRTLFTSLLEQTYFLKPLPSITPPPSAAGLAALDVPGWTGAAHACGLMCWSPVLIRELRAPVVRDLEQQFGPVWWEWVERGLGITQNALAPLLHETWPAAPDAWLAFIQGTGFAVLDVWVGSLDQPLAAWVRLKGPEQGEGRASPWGGDRALALALVDGVSKVLRKTS